MFPNGQWRASLFGAFTNVSSPRMTANVAQALKPRVAIFNSRKIGFNVVILLKRNLPPGNTCQKIRSGEGEGGNIGIKLLKNTRRKEAVDDGW